MRIVGLIAAVAGALGGIISARGLISVGLATWNDVDFAFPPEGETLGLIAVALCALALVGAFAPLGDRLGSVLMVVAGGAFWYFLPEYALPAVPLFLIGGVAGFFD